VRTDSASLTFFRQRIAQIVAVWSAIASLTFIVEFFLDHGLNSLPLSGLRRENSPNATAGSRHEVVTMNDEGMTGRHSLTPLLAVAAGLKRGDVVAVE